MRGLELPETLTRDQADLFAAKMVCAREASRIAQREAEDELDAVIAAGAGYDECARVWAIFEGHRATADELHTLRHEV